MARLVIVILAVVGCGLLLLQWPQYTNHAILQNQYGITWAMVGCLGAFIAAIKVTK